ncbi:MAG TPA: LysM peptidoglycan-binding domain-containing protein [Actinotalea sp.]|jgi:nucleoid-associated protein YgaU
MTTLVWDAQPGVRRDGAARRPAAARPATATRSPGVSDLRLTGRGRTVALVLGAALAVGAALSAQSAAAGSPADPVRVETVTVAAGETLWEIAGQVAGRGEDRRDVVARLMDLNGLTETGLVAGQQIFIPSP